MKQTALVANHVSLHGDIHLTKLGHPKCTSWTTKDIKAIING